MRLIFLLVGLLLALFEADQLKAKTVTDKWVLWTGGTQLRGANIWQRRVYLELDGHTFMEPGPVGPLYTKEDFNLLAEMGVNYVNISYLNHTDVDPSDLIDVIAEHWKQNTLRPFSADTYYVAISGNDGNSGTLEDPWRTIQHAADVLQAGQIVYVREGTYFEAVTTKGDGNAADGYIVFSTYPGETPIIDGTGVTTSNTGFSITNSYIKLSGLEIRNWDTGIWMEIGGHIEISDCEVHEVFYGIGAANGAHDFELNRVEIHHFTLYGFDASPSGGVDCYNGTFNDCVAHTGRDAEQNVDGFALGHGTQHDFVFNRCEVYDVFDGFDISARNIVLNRCLAHDCWSGNYKIWQDSVELVNCIGYNGVGANVELDWDGESGVTTLMNCTFFNAQTYTIWIENANDALHMYNCILADGDNIGLAFEQTGIDNYQGDYNIFHMDNSEDRAIAVAYTDEFSLDEVAAGDWAAYSGQDTHSLVIYSDTNLFVDPSNFDFHLLQTSLAVDHGTNLGAPAEDYDGNPRPSGAGYDIGAYEYQYSTGVANNNEERYTPAAAILFQNYPNPFNSLTKINYQIAANDLPVHATLKIYDILGREIITLVNEQKESGSYSIMWNGRNKLGQRVTNGVYFYQLQTGDFIQTSKMILLR